MIVNETGFISTCFSTADTKQSSRYVIELEQLECLRSEDTPAALWLPILLSHIGYRVKRRQSQGYKFKEFVWKFQIFKFWNKHYTQHTFWSCLIRCANMKWIRLVLLKLQSGHDSVHRRTDRRTDGRMDGQTDGRTDGRTMWNQYTPFQLRWSGGIMTEMVRKSCWLLISHWLNLRLFSEC